MRMRVLRWVPYYYAATIAFALVDYVFGANVRAAGFAAYPVLRFAYYGACLVCGVVARRVPSLSAPLVLIETTVNLTTLVLAVFGTYFVFILEGSVEHMAAWPELIVNFLVAATAGILAFHQAVAALPRSMRNDLASYRPRSSRTGGGND